ncbi:organic cation transporter protein-like [Haliotis rufescens]|uniref:organic cation transporter protein-like n=1 Tax=Haliotis rufescens TaxID=6454 RepID=UPI00201F96E3|nr:organic cation transporter protein-like [Haliotis rufescens]
MQFLLSCNEVNDSSSHLVLTCVLRHCCIFSALFLNFGQCFFRTMNFDDVLRQLGEFGTYQKWLYVLLCLPAIAGSIQVIQAVVFLFAVPEHRCAIPGFANDTYEIQNNFHEQLVNRSIPMTSGYYGDDKYSRCQLYLQTNTSDVWSSTRNVTGPCHAWVYDQSQFISTISETMDFVCEKKSYASHAKMLGMFGHLVGALINGPMSDMFGRRPVIICNMFIMVLLSICLVWSSSAPVVLFLDFVIHTCTLGQYLVCFVFGMEIVGPSKRMWAGVAMNLFWSAGNMVTALTAYLFRDWKTRQLIVSVPAVVFAYLYFIPESPRWLLKHGKMEEAKRIVANIAKKNKVKIDPNILDEVDIKKEEVKQEPFWNLLKSSVMMRRMIIICYNWFAVGMAFYGLSMNVSNLSGSIYLNFFLFITVEAVAYISCFVVMDRIGRKLLLCISLSLTGAACILPLVPVLVSDTPEKWAINILAIVGNTCASAAMCAVYTFTAELMPTTSRTFGMSMSSICCRVGSLLSPYIVDLTMYISGRFGQILPMLIFGGITILAAFLTLLLPETLNKKLPETIKEAEMLGTNAYDEDVTDASPVELIPLEPESGERAGETENNNDTREKDAIF